MSSAGSASVEISKSPDEVWAAIADITRMGEWSPECTGGRWVGGATRPTLGAKFEGDNEVKIAGRTVKKWTTTSEVTASDPGKVFEFIAEGYTTWRYDFAPSGAGTRIACAAREMPPRPDSWHLHHGAATGRDERNGMRGQEASVTGARTASSRPGIAKARRAPNGWSGSAWAT